MYFLNLSQSVDTETHHILENEINIRQEEKDYINKEEKSFISHFVCKESKSNPHFQALLSFNSLLYLHRIS